MTHMKVFFLLTIAAFLMSSIVVFRVIPARQLESAMGEKWYGFVRAVGLIDG